MKKTLFILGIVALAATAQTDAEKEELADRLLEAMRQYERIHYKEAFEQHRKLLEQGIKISAPHYPPSVEARANAALQYAKTNGILLEAVLEVAKAQVMSSCTALKASFPNPPPGDGREGRKWELTGEGSAGATARYTWMQAVLVAAGDLSSLPLIEEANRSLNYPWARKSSALAYISIASTNSAPFLCRFMGDDRTTTEERFFVLEHFIKVLDNVQSINDESFAFLYGIVEKNSDVISINGADNILCRKLPGYSTSLQRLTVASRYAKDDNPYVKEYFASAKEAIEKIPENERKDFRTKGGLLDPDRKKEP